MKAGRRKDEGAGVWGCAPGFEPSALSCGQECKALKALTFCDERLERLAWRGIGYRVWLAEGVAWRPLGHLKALKALKALIEKSERLAFLATPQQQGRTLLDLATLLIVWIC